MRIPAILFFAGLTLFASAQTDEKPVWHQDWRAAQRSAKETNKPIFAVMVCRH